jgi:NAD(P)-dependent dehydrogenase (short-subunit alcohol dehydrogenase family)
LVYLCYTSCSQTQTLLTLVITGLALVQVLAKRDNVLIFAGVRKPSSSLEALASQNPDKVRIVTLTSGDKTDNEAAVAEIKRIAGRLDVVIANAALGDFTGPVLETSAQDMATHFHVNTIGTLVLFQSTYPLLKASTETPKFIPISSRIGSIELGTQGGIGFLAYGASKAAVNYMARKIRADHEGLGAFAS